MVAAAAAPLYRHPLLRAALTSGLAMSAGDALCQVIRARGLGKEIKLDLRQTLRFGVVGITLHGPFFFRGFRWLDSRFGGAEPTLHSAIVKTAVGQITLFPCYTAAFFLYIGLLEGLPPPQCVAKLQALPTTLATGSVFWPAVNIANFLFVPPSGRIVYVSACGILWNAYLSHKNSRPAPAAVAAATALQ